MYGILNLKENNGSNIRNDMFKQMAVPSVAQKTKVKAYGTIQGA
jgi:hypothetical protein